VISRGNFSQFEFQFLNNVTSEAEMRDIIAYIETD